MRNVPSDTLDADATTVEDDDATATTAIHGIETAGEDGHTTAPPVAECGNGALEPGEGCDDGNLVSGDGCLPNCMPGGPLAPVWSTSADWPRCLAVLDGSLVGDDVGAFVVGGGSFKDSTQLELAPLAPDGPIAWSYAGPAARVFSALAIAADGDIIAAGRDHSMPGSPLWLARFTSGGEPVWSHDFPDERDPPLHVQVAPNGDIVALVGPPSRIIGFDAAGALRWVHAPNTVGDWAVAYGGLALGEEGRVHVVGHSGEKLAVAFKHLVLEALTPQGESIWRREDEMPFYVSQPRVGVMPDGSLRVVVGRGIETDPYDDQIAALAAFDAAGELQWWRDDPSISALQVSPHAVVSLPSGGVFVAWSLYNIDSRDDEFLQYDAAGALVSGLSPWGTVFDLDLGPGGLVYSLEAMENWERDGGFQVIPYQP